MPQEPVARPLFVCSANACRSPAAERLFNAEAERLGLSARARSCGVAAELHYRMPPQTRAALSARGISSDAHRARLADAELMRWTDAALAMTRAQRDFLKEKFPQHSAKIHLLLEFCGLDGGDVADPMGKPAAAHEAAVAVLERAVAALLARERRGT